MFDIFESLQLVAYLNSYVFNDYIYIYCISSSRYKHVNFLEINDNGFAIDRFRS
jgi:hypothetical protein